MNLEKRTERRCFLKNITLVFAALPVLLRENYNAVRFSIHNFKEKTDIDRTFDGLQDILIKV